MCRRGITTATALQRMWFESVAVAGGWIRATAVPPRLRVESLSDQISCGRWRESQIMSNPQRGSAIRRATQQAAWANRPTYW